MLLSMENWKIRAAIIFSRDLLRALSSDIGLYDSGHFSLLHFGIRIMVATFYAARRNLF